MPLQLCRLQFFIFVLEQNSLTLWHQKTRVSSLSQQTILRFELLSCLLIARLITHVLAALETVIEVRLGSCFTDSKVALFWIQGEGKEWKTFVHNRVKEM